MLLAAFAVLVICIVAFCVALTGRRRGAQLHCIKCEHVVEGIRESRCPECGADLSTSEAMVRGGRRRNFVLLWVAIVGFIASGPFVVSRLHRALIAPGWEREAPYWWVTQIELRFATGARFDQACSGVLRGARAVAPGNAQLDGTGTRVFDRLRSQPETQMPMHTSEVFTLAGMAGEVSNCDVEELCRVVKACTLLPVQSAGDTAQSKVDRPEFKFIPKGWEVKFSNTVVDSSGKSIGRSGTGIVSWTPQGRRSAFTGGQKPNESGSYQVAWTFELCRIGESASATWKDTTAFVYDHEKATQRIQKGLEESQRELKALIKKTKEEQAAREEK